MIWVSLAFATEEGFLREPYLQRLTPTEVTVVWREDTEHAARLCWGEDPNDLDNIVDFKKEKKQFEARLHPLEPDTTYHYRVEHLDEGTTTEIKAFETPPPVGTKARTRFWVVGDSGNGSLDQRAVFDAMRTATRHREPDHFIHVGDMAYGSGLEVEFTLFFYWVYEDLLDEVPVWPTIGNHEGKTSNSQKNWGPYYDGYVLPTDGRAGGLPSGTEAWYSVDIANLHLVVLDSHESPREPDGAMLTWLAEDLAATQQEWIIASWHHPPYSKGSHDSDREGQLIEMRENVLPILEAGGVDLVLTGHSHVYERSYLIDGAYETPTTTAGITDPGMGRLPDPYTKPLGSYPNQGAVYVVAGHGGASVSAEEEPHPVMAVTEVDHGSVLLDLHGPTLNLRNIRHDGEVTDTMTLVKGPAVIYDGPDDQRVQPGATLELSAVTVGIEAEPTFSWSCNEGQDWHPAENPWTVPDLDGLVILRAEADYAEDWSDGNLRVAGDGPCPGGGDSGLGPESPDEGCSTLPLVGLWWLGLVVVWRRST